ncbi:hypothetical protein [Lysobacter sp. GCM10012299]|uniref:hypothetical protein n=1 Tax=Lysobacter sp. GCM10012299 TaxID=3317333 RepID=UPI003605ADDF
MIRKLLVPAFAALLLAGCITDYGYRGYGGAGDYYYGRPSVEYRYYGGYGGYYGGWGGYYPYATPYGYGGYGYPYRYAYPYRYGYGPYGYPGYRAPYYNYPRYNGHGGGHGHGYNGGYNGGGYNGGGYHGGGGYNHGNRPNRPGGWAGQVPTPQPGVQPGPRPDGQQGGRPGSVRPPQGPEASNEPRPMPRNNTPRHPSAGRERVPRQEP